MAVFGDLAHKFYDLGINVLPIVENKRPPKGFTFKKWLYEKQTEDDIDKLVSEHGHCPGIAVVCGPVSGICGFDYDYKYDEKKMPPEFNKKKYELEYAKIELEIRRQLPDWALAKKAKEGWTSFYKCESNFETITCDRNSVRVFDFKATGYIVIPPSFHSFVDGKAVHYSWIVGDPMDDFIDLPQLDINIIKDLKLAFQDKQTAPASGRHGNIFKYAMNILQIESDIKKVAQMMMDFDAKEHKEETKGLYFMDKNHVGADAFKYAVGWANRIKHFMDSKSIKPQKAVVNETDTWDYFLESQFYDLKKCILDKKVYTKKAKDHPWIPITSVIKVLRSYATRKGLPKTQVEDEIERYVYERDKLDFRCEIPEWDGEDYIGEMCIRLKSQYFTGLEIAEIFREWGSKIFARVEDSRNQNRCIILKGPQNIGKDTWVRNLCEGFDPYYRPIVPPDTNKDWLEIISSLFIIHIEEFDQTAKVDIPFLKSIITQPSVYFRESYGRDPSKKTTAPSFIATVNPDDFFRDPTGNRRFAVIPLDSIDFNYPHGVSLKIMSQFRHYHRQGGYKLDSEIERKIKYLIDSLTPESNEVTIEELWLEKSKSKIAFSTGKYLTQSDASEIFMTISRLIGVTPTKVRRTIKSKDYQKTVGNQRVWSAEVHNDSKS